MPVGRDGMGRVTPLEAAPTDTSPVARALVLAGELSVRAAELTPRREGRRRAAFQRLLDDPGGTRFVFSLADRVLRPEDPVAAAGQLAVLARGDLAGTSPLDRVLLRAGGVAGRIAPSPVVRLAGARLRRETRELVGPSEPPKALGRRLGRQWSAGRRPNLNLLGEAVLGWEEARRRAAAVEALLRRPDVDCVSVKASSIAAGLSLVDFDGSVARIREPLVGLYRAALESNPPKLVNLDMEEHRDLDLTLGVFMSVLDRPRVRLARRGDRAAGVPARHPRCARPAAAVGRRARRLGRVADPRAPGEGGQPGHGAGRGRGARVAARPL